MGVGRGGEGRGREKQANASPTNGTVCSFTISAED